MSLEFVKGVATVKHGRKIAAKVYDRDVTGYHGRVNRYAVILCLAGGNSIQADFPRLEDCYPHLEKHMGLSQAGMVL